MLASSLLKAAFQQQFFAAFHNSLLLRLLLIFMLGLRLEPNRASLAQSALGGLES